MVECKSKKLCLEKRNYAYMAKKLGVFSRKERALIIDLVESFSSGELVEFTIDELRDDYKLNTDQVLACIMFVNKTAEQVISA